METLSRLRPYPPSISKRLSLIDCISIGVDRMQKDSLLVSMGGSRGGEAQRLGQTPQPIIRSGEQPWVRFPLRAARAERPRRMQQDQEWPPSRRGPQDPRARHRITA